MVRRQLALWVFVARYKPVRFAVHGARWICFLTAACHASATGEQVGSAAVVDALFSDVSGAVDFGAGGDAATKVASVAEDTALRPDRRPVPPAVSCDICPGAYTSPVVIGKLDLARLDEASGLAASRVHSGVYYSHNDRGNRPELFVLSQAGTTLGIFALTSAPTVDVEDVALGPCPTGSCLYLADTGNNRRDRSEFALYRIAEPDVRLGEPFRTESVGFERFPLRYEDGAPDVEGLLVDPMSGAVYLITKPATGPCTVY
jgi:hypothetical protein